MLQEGTKIENPDESKQKVIESPTEITPPSKPQPESCSEVQLPSQPTAQSPTPAADQSLPQLPTQPPPKPQIPPKTFAKPQLLPKPKPPPATEEIACEKSPCPEPTPTNSIIENKESAVSSQGCFDVTSNLISYFPLLTYIFDHPKEIKLQSWQRIF